MEPSEPLADIQATTVRVRHDRGIKVASLRYFKVDDSLDSAVAAALGLRLPGTLRAVGGSADPRRADVLAWRSPSDTLYLSESPVRFDSAAAALASQADCWFIEQTGGLSVLRVEGSGVANLFASLGGHALLPGPGESKPGRLADLPILSFDVGGGETWMVVERVYLAHLMNWLRDLAGT